MMETSSHQQASTGSHGLSLITAALFIVGETAGTGVLALPQAVAGCGWFGIGAIVLACFAAGFTGIFLGKSWLLVEQLHPQYAHIKVRDPYPLIGEKAAGKCGKVITTITLIIQMAGGAICFLLISSELIFTIIDVYKVPTLSGIKFGEWILIVGAILIPLSWLGSPADFWPIAVIAMSSTAVASVMVSYLIVTSDNHSDNVPRVVPSASTFFISLGTICFGVGGASGMPTFQMDMKNKSHFTPAVTLAYIMMLLIFLPLSVLGYVYYGSSVQSNILRMLTSGPLLTTINVLMASHVLSAFLIAINPVNLLIEDAVQLEHSFNWRRCTLRTLVGIFCIFVALSIPRFGKILNFVGASAISIQSFVLPPLFYMMLTWKLQVENAQSLVSGLRRPSDGKVLNNIPIDSVVTRYNGNSGEESGKRNGRLVSVNAQEVHLENKTFMKISVKKFDFLKVEMNVFLKSGLIAVFSMGIFIAISASSFSLKDLIDPKTFIAPCYVTDCNVGD